MKKLLLALLFILLPEYSFALCDSVFADSKTFGITDTWKLKNNSTAGTADFRASCRTLEQCYTGLNAQRNQCEKDYHENLKKACDKAFYLNQQAFGKCMRNVNSAAKFVKENNASYFNTLQRKVRAQKREEDRKIRAEKRREDTRKRAEERRKERRKNPTVY